MIRKKAVSAQFNINQGNILIISDINLMSSLSIFSSKLSPCFVLENWLENVDLLYQFSFNLEVHKSVFKFLMYSAENRMADGTFIVYGAASAYK